MRAVALRHLQRVPEALATLERLEDAHPGYPRLFQERGHCHVFLRQAPEAIRAFARAVELNPALPASWRMLAALHRMVGRPAESAVAEQHVAEARHARAGSRDRPQHARGRQPGEADELLPAYLRRVRTTSRRCACSRRSRTGTSSRRTRAILLEAVLAAKPDYRAARHDYVLALIAMHRYKDAREQVDILICAEPTTSPIA